MGGLENLHALFLDALVPVCADLLAAATASGQVRDRVQPYALVRAVGNLRIGVEDDPACDARPVVALLLAGLRRPG